MTSSVKKITEFGAWAGLTGLKNPVKYKKLAEQTGIDLLDFMVNDGSKKKPFHLYLPEDQIEKNLSIIRESGAKIALTTWAQPDPTWSAGMQTVGELATRVEAVRVTLDLEESYINELKNKSMVEIFTWAVAIVGTLRKYYNGPIAIAPIVYANKRVLNDVLKLVDIIIPQTYATLKNVPGAGHDGSLEKAAKDIYKGYGAYIIMGAAAWNLEGAYGKSFLEALKTSIETTLSIDITEFMYWRFEFLTKEILDTIRMYLEDKNVG